MNRTTHLHPDDLADRRLKAFGSEYDRYEAECGRLHEEPMTFTEYCREQESDL